MLSHQEEQDLARRWSETGDISAAHQLVTSHLRLVAKLALRYRGYGLPMAEIISEGNIGLMQAVKRFDVERGFRLSTYAMWWIRASIQEYVLRSWSLVKTGTTTSKKKLFFNLRRLKNQLRIVEEGEMRPSHIQQISQTLGVSKNDVVEMNRRLSGTDSSLNAVVSRDVQGEWQDWLVDENPDQETVLGTRQESDHRHRLLVQAMAGLSERERVIFSRRRLDEDPPTLEVLSNEYGISRERVRQIEAKVFEKIGKSLRASAKRH